MTTELAELIELQQELDVVKINRRANGHILKSSWRARDRWDTRWAKSFNAYFTSQHKHIDVERLVKRVTKSRADDAAAAIRAELDEESFTDGALKLYLGLALDTGEDAGQFTLDALGLDKTFAWAGARDFARDPLAVRGSKVIQRMYGTHVSRLATLVANVADPAKPKPVQELTRTIKKEWSGVSLRQARVIARTEAAAVWETTNFNAMALNDVKYVDWIVATGPSIGRGNEPVCELCIAMAATSPWVIDDLPITPPRHPNCRCTIVPVDDPDWLPPAEPWTGFLTEPLELVQ